MQGYLNLQYHEALVEQRIDVQLKCGIMGISWLIHGMTPNRVKNSDARGTGIKGKR